MMMARRRIDARSVASEIRARLFRRRTGRCALSDSGRGSTPRGVPASACAWSPVRTRRPRRHVCPSAGTLCLMIRAAPRVRFVRTCWADIGTRGWQVTRFPLSPFNEVACGLRADRLARGADLRPTTRRAVDQPSRPRAGPRAIQLALEPAEHRATGCVGIGISVLTPACRQATRAGRTSRCPSPGPADAAHYL